MNAISKPVTQKPDVQLTLSGEEAELLREITFAINWDGGLVGEFARDLSDELGNVDVPVTLGETKKFDQNTGTLQITLKRETENVGRN